MFNVPLHRVRQLRRTELAGELKAPNASALPTRSQCTPKSNAFSGTPPKLVGALIKGNKPYTKGIAKVYEKLVLNELQFRERGSAATV